MATTRGRLRFQDLRASAPYTQTTVTDECYRLTHDDSDRSPWSYYDDWRLMSSFHDPQHVLYNKGVGSDLFGGMLKSLCQDNFFPGDTLLEQVNNAYEDYMEDDTAQEKDSHTPKPFTLRRMSMHKPNIFPTVACGYKHGQIRTMLHWICNVSAQPTETPVQQLRHFAAKHLSGFILFLDDASAMLSTTQQAHALNLGQHFLDAYSLLYELDQRAGAKLWFMRPKHHAMFHIVDRLRHSRSNPLFQYSNWMEEDFMGKQSKIAKMCHPSVAGLFRALQRYVVYLYAEFVT